ncbi:CDP-glycerol glycerophosphotransferase family protein [Glutamicibacter sp. AOP3-A1-12]|uniref:CDP-glycerol glycerophosphotransferase family protein n=1 Tax=Glutamicibacter sp. AOP3-A1-12 TaxID=3457701 RepID=UPI0040336188
MNRFSTRVILGIGRRIEHRGKFRLAAIFYERALATKLLKSDEIRFRLGFCQFKMKKYSLAMVNMESAIAHQPHRFGWIQALAMNMQRMKKFDRALELFAAACAGQPQNIRWHTRYAKCAVAARKKDLAGSILENLVVRFPAEPSSSASLADHLLQTGQRWRELEVRQAYAPVHELEAKWMLLTGQAAQFMARFEISRDYFQQATALDPEYSKAWYGLARAYEELGEYENAQRADAQAVLTSNDEQISTLGVGRLHERANDWMRASESYREALAASNSPGTRQGLNYRAGEVNSKLFNLEAAAKHFGDAREAATTVEEQVLSAYAQARVYARAGNFAGAADTYSSFVELLPEQSRVEEPVALYRYAHALHRMNDYEQAARVYLRAASAWGYLDGKLKVPAAAGPRAAHHIDLAQAAEERGQWDDAAEAYRDALWHTSTTQRTWQARAGQALAKSGEPRVACDYFENMLLFTEISVAGLGTALKGVGRHRGALYIHSSEQLPLDEKLVLFESSHGKNVHCHPLAIYQAMRQDERFDGFRYAWVYNDHNEVPAQLSEDLDVAIIKQHSDAYIRVLGTAKYLVNNATFPAYYSRREGQQVLNTWHGTPLKFMGKLVKGAVGEHRNVQRNFLHTTHLMVPNRHTLKTLSQDHDLDGMFPATVALTGSPRVDSMVNLSAQRRAEILTELGIDPQNHEPVVLFAPTWRGQLNDRSYNVDSLVTDVAKMARGDHQMLFRAHRFAEQLIGDAQLDATVVPASIDTNELLAVVDVLITDYSSIFYDFLPARKPVLFYTPDFEAYDAERGLYFERESWPGEVSDSIDDLVSSLRQTLQAPAGTAHPNFEENLAEFAPMEDGNASARVIEFFFFEDQAHVLAPEADARTKLLFYQGPFKPNGIATAFVNLIGSLDPDKYLVAVAVDMNATGSDPAAMEILNSLPSHVKVLPRAGATAMSAEERWVSDSFHAQRGFSSAEAENIHLGTMAREMNRSFGSARFDMAINFEGYSRFWAALFAAAHSHAASTSIYLHNDMVGEWLLRFGTMPGLFATYGHYDALVSVTDSVGEINQRQLGEQFGIDESKFTVSENLLDLNKPSDWAELSEPVHEFSGEGLTIFANMARLSPEKGQAKLLHAFARVHAAHANTRLLLIGDGPLRLSLEEQITELGLSGQVVITGLLANPFPTLKSADCFVFSSDYEGQGLAMIEAMMLGLPAISTDVVGSRSVLTGGFGLLVENSVEGLAEGMEHHLNGYKAELEFDAERYQLQALEQFETLVKSPVPTGSRLG